MPNPQTLPQGQHAKSPARPKAGNERRTTVAAAKGLLVGTARSGRGYQDADPVIASSQGPPGTARAGNSADVVLARLATAGIATLPLTALERVYLSDVWDGNGEKGAGEGIAREIRALMPASAKLLPHEPGMLLQERARRRRPGRPEIHFPGLALARRHR